MRLCEKFLEGKTRVGKILPNITEQFLICNEPCKYGQRYILKILGKTSVGICKSQGEIYELIER